jgi:hypothetical protein
VRGLLQGWPKKLGTTWLTRSLPLDHPAAAPLRRGSRLGASLAVKDRRLLEAEATLTGGAGRALGFLALPTVGAVAWPDLCRPGDLPVPRLVAPVISGRTGGEWHQATATLRLFDHPGEELDRLGQVRATEASAGWVGITVEGAREA